VVGLCLDPLGSLHSTDPLAGFKRPSSKGRSGEKRRGRDSRRRGGRRGEEMWSFIGLRGDGRSYL